MPTWTCVSVSHVCLMWMMTDVMRLEMKWQATIGRPTHKLDSNMPTFTIVRN